MILIMPIIYTTSGIFGRTRSCSHISLAVEFQMVNTVFSKGPFL